MKNRLLSLIVVLAAAFGTAACQSPTGPKKVELCLDQNAQNYNQPAPCVPKPVPASASAELLGTSPASPATRIALDILPDGTKVGDPSIKATIKFALSQAQIDEIRAQNEKGLLQACLSADGVNPVKGACDLHWVEEGKTTDTVTLSLSVKKFYEYVEKTPYILFTIGRASQTDPSKPHVVFTDGKFSFRVDFTWK